MRVFCKSKCIIQYIIQSYCPITTSGITFPYAASVASCYITVNENNESNSPFSEDHCQDSKKQRRNRTTFTTYQLHQVFVISLITLSI